MVAYYRLKELNARLEGGARIISAREFETIGAATEILSAADARAEAIAEEAERAFEAEKKRGYQEGLRKAEMDSVVRLASEQRALDEALCEIESELISLVESCVRKLVASFQDTARAEAAVRQALGTMRRERRAELRAPPALFGYFRETVEAIRADFPEIELIDVVEDESLDLDQVIVESAIGRVDAHLGQRMEEFRRLLLAGAGVEDANGGDLELEEFEDALDDEKGAEEEPLGDEDSDD